MLNLKSETARSLRNALRANAVFSALSGLLIIFLHSQVLLWLGLAEINIMVKSAISVLSTIGVGLVLFSAYLFWMSSREQIDKSMVIGVIGGDWLWVVASAVLLVFKGSVFSTLGIFLVTDVALVVMVFAIWQQRGLSRMTITG